MQKSFLFGFFTLSSAIAVGQEMTPTQAINLWEDKVSREIPSSSLDYEIQDWASKNGLEFKLYPADENETSHIKYLFKAVVGKFEVESDDWECNYHLVVIKFRLNEFKQVAGGFNVGRETSCNHDRI